jgi:hypothetical protein
LSDLIELHDSKTDSWSIAGRLPYASKTSTICHEGWLYAIAGQRARGGNDFHPTVVLDAVWRAKFDPATLVS